MSYSLLIIKKLIHGVDDNAANVYLDIFNVFEEVYINIIKQDICNC